MCKNFSQYITVLLCFQINEALLSNIYYVKKKYKKYNDLNTLP